MALETLTVQTAGRAGAELAYQAVTNVGGFKFINDGKTMMFVKNDAGDLVITAAIQPTVDSEAVDVKTVTVTASETWVSGVWPTEWYNDTSDYVICTVDADLADGIALVTTG